MDAATVREIVNTIKAHDMEDVVMVDGVEPSNVYYLRQADGGLIRTTAVPWPRRYGASRVQDIIDIVKRMGEQGKVKDVAIFCQGGTVTALLDETKREDDVELVLPPSAQFSAVRALGNLWQTPKDLISNLRVNLSDAVPLGFLTWLKQLKFQSSSTSESDVQVGKESMGRSIQNQVSGAGEVPEEVIIRVPVYEGMVDDAGYLIRFDVTCIVDLDYTRGALRLVPIPSSVLTASRDADEWIAEKLRTLEKQEPRIASVFCGKADRN